VRTELFRPEAVAAHAEAAAAGRSLPSSRRMLAQAATALAIAILIAIAVSAIVQIDETTEGTWTPDTGGTITVFVPVGALGRLSPGQTVRLDGATADATVAGPPRPTVTAGGETRAAVSATFVMRDGTIGVHGLGGKAVVVLDRRSVLSLVVDAFGRGFRRG
jgi:hypothetical protein